MESNFLAIKGVLISGKREIDSWLKKFELGWAGLDLIGLAQPNHKNPQVANPSHEQAKGRFKKTYAR